MIFSRLVIATTLLLLIHLFNKKREGVEKKDYLTFFFMGFTEPFLYFIGEGYGMKYVSSTHASVIIATIPVFAMLAAVVLYKEKISRTNILGVIISFSGIVVMIGLKILQEKGSIIGLLLMFLAVIAAVTNSLIIYRLGNRYSSLTIITMQNLVGALLFLPLFFLLEFNSINVDTFNMEFWSSILFLAIFPSVISFLLYISTLKKIGITKTSAFSNMIPIITGIISFIMLGSRFSPREVLGIIIVIFGLFLTQRTDKVIIYE